MPEQQLNQRMMLLFLLVCVFVCMVSGVPAIGVVVSVRGKKYDAMAETVNEVIEQIEKSASLEPNQHVVLFRGKVLNEKDNLQDLGISAGDVLNVVKKRVQRVRAEDENQKESSVSSAKNPYFSDDAMKAAAENVNPEDMKKAMEAMDNLLDSNFIDEYFGDDEKLERARLQMLENMDQYEKTMPGFREQAEEIASDPQKWREAMQQAKEQILILKQKRDALRKNKGDL